MAQLNETVTTDLCVDFIDAWQEDLSEWQRFSSGVNKVGSTRAAMDFLELKHLDAGRVWQSRMNLEAVPVSSPALVDA